MDPSLRLGAFIAKERVTGSGTIPRYFVDEKAGKVDISILDIHYINVYFTSTPSSTRVIDTGSVAKC